MEKFSAFRYNSDRPIDPADSNVTYCLSIIEDKSVRDNDLTAQEATQFKVMFFVFLACTIYALISTIVLIRAMKKKWKVQMLLFYVFADITLICKYYFRSLFLFNSSKPVLYG